MWLTVIITNTLPKKRERQQLSQKPWKVRKLCQLKIVATRKEEIKTLQRRVPFLTYDLLLYVLLVQMLFHWATENSENARKVRVIYASKLDLQN